MVIPILAGIFITLIFILWHVMSMSNKTTNVYVKVKCNRCGGEFITPMRVHHCPICGGEIE